MAIEKLYPVNEDTAETIALTLGTLRQYVSNGVIEAVYLGRKRAIKASTIERICNEGLVTKRKDTEKVETA